MTNDTDLVRRDGLVALGLGRVYITPLATLIIIYHLVRRDGLVALGRVDKVQLDVPFSPEHQHSTTLVSIIMVIITTSMIISIIRIIISINIIISDLTPTCLKRGQ